MTGAWFYVAFFGISAVVANKWSRVHHLGAWILGSLAVMFFAGTGIGEGVLSGGETVADAAIEFAQTLWGAIEKHVA